MKGGLAMMLAALLRAKAEGLIPAGDIVLAVLSDEEAGGDYGAKYLVESSPEQFEGIRYALGEFGGFSFYILLQKLDQHRLPVHITPVARQMVESMLRPCPSLRASFWANSSIPL